MAPKYNFSKAQQRFLAVLAVFSDPIPVETAALLSSILPGELLKLIRQPETADWLIESDNNCILLTKKIPEDVARELKAINSLETMKGYLQEIRRSDSNATLPTAALIELLGRCGQTEEIIDLASEAAMSAIEADKIESAISNLLACLSHAEKVIRKGSHTETYIWAAVKLAGFSLTRPDLWERTVRHLHHASTLSRKIGDQRSLALIKIYLGWSYQGKAQIQEAKESFQSGLDIVKSLGDEEIMAQSAELAGYYYATQGYCREALDFFDQALSYNFTRQTRPANSYFPAYYGATAAQAGQFYSSIAILNSALRQAESVSNSALTRFYTAVLGNVHLTMQEPEKAFSYLQSAQEQSEKAGDIMSLIFSLRSLSWYYASKGDYAKSYEMLQKCLESARKIGSTRPFYGHSSILETLFALHCNGYQSLPIYDFNTEMELALNGANAILKGAALRIRAQMSEMQNATPDVTLSYLERSRDILMKTGNPIELSKTHLELAGFHLRQNDRDQAAADARRAWQLCTIDGNVLLAKRFSPELKELTGFGADLEESTSFSEEMIDRYLKMVEEFLPTAVDEHEHRGISFSRILVSTSRFFNSERCGIFSYESGGFPRLTEAGFHLTQAETEADDFQPILEQLDAAIQADHPIIKTLDLDSSGKNGRFLRILCLPFRKENESRYVLYHDSSFNRKAFSISNPRFFAQLASHLGKYLFRIDRYRKAAEETAHLSIVQNAGAGDAHDIISRHPVMTEQLLRGDQVAPSEAPVLIQGETGVGKELFARRIHKMSRRAARPFVVVNFSSIPETLLESELFGHEKGAFTGAINRKPGLLELADKGTLFIDEVGDIPKSIQVKLLRALQEKTFTRVGGVSVHHSDFRIVSATNRDMAQEVAGGHFREDLYYRLNVIPMAIPSLRQRGEDVLLLAEYFLSEYSKKYNRKVPKLTPENQAALAAYTWPGNVRELKNAMERAVILASSGTLDLTGLTAPVTVLVTNDNRAGDNKAHLSREIESVPNGPQADRFADRPSLDEMQRRYIQYILDYSGGKISGPGGAAEILDIKPPTLYYRMKRLGLNLK